jgi:hypothetical protein
MVPLPEFDQSVVHPLPLNASRRAWPEKGLMARSSSRPLPATKSPTT